MIKVRRVLIHLLICTPWVGFAQGVSDFYQTKSESGHTYTYGLRAGLNYSFPIVSSVPLPQSIHLGGVTPRYGFYVGGFYSKPIINGQVSFRVDATLQRKGVRSRYVNGQINLLSSYYYVGVNPQIGLRLTNNVTLLAGVEANQLIRTQNPWGKADPLEIGPTLRLACTFGHFGAELSYFRGFTKFTQVNVPVSGLEPYDFYNQNVQIGLIYTWGRN